MVDTVNLKLTCADVGNVDFIANVANLGPHGLIWHENESGQALTATLGNLKVFANEGMLLVGNGSICKWYKGNNYQAMTLADIRNALTQLSDILQVPMKRATITRLDYGLCFPMSEPIANYLPHLGEMQRRKRLIQAEGVYYRASRNSEDFYLYDKNRAQRDSREPIPDQFKACNVLRVEVRLFKQIPRRIGVPAATASLLCDERFYAQMQADIVHNYQSIEKINTETIDFAKMDGVKDLHKLGLLALAKVAGGPLELLEQLNAMQRRGQLNRLQANRCRKVAKDAFEWREGLTTQSAALLELDSKICGLLEGENANPQNGTFSHIL